MPVYKSFLRLPHSPVHPQSGYKETGEEKTILFGLTGTGYFDMVAYEKFHNGEMGDYIPTDEELQIFPPSATFASASSKRLYGLSFVPSPEVSINDLLIDV